MSASYNHLMNLNKLKASLVGLPLCQKLSNPSSPQKQLDLFSHKPRENSKNRIKASQNLTPQSKPAKNNFYDTI